MMGRLAALACWRPLVALLVPDKVMRVDEKREGRCAAALFAKIDAAETARAAEVLRGAYCARSCWEIPAGRFRDLVHGVCWIRRRESLRMCGWFRGGGGCGRRTRPSFGRCGTGNVLPAALGCRKIRAWGFSTQSRRESNPRRFVPLYDYSSFNSLSMFHHSYQVPSLFNRSPVSRKLHPVKPPCHGGTSDC